MGVLYVYLSFTFMSILVQYAIMDILEKKKASDLSVDGHEIIKNIKSQPHALYYKMGDNSTDSTIYTNSSITANPLNDMYPTITSFYEVLYEDNITTTVRDTTDLLEAYTTTEYSNATEFEIFHKTPTTTAKPKIEPKKTEPNDNCFCNLNYNTCDINCCCDKDCNVGEREIFKTCLNDDVLKPNTNCENNMNIFSIDNLLCNAKKNVPMKRNTVTYGRESEISVEILKKKSFNWHDKKEDKDEVTSLRKQYEQGDPVWLMNEGVLSILDFPIPQYNNHCSGRRNVKFLNNEHHTCIVKLQALESLSIHKHMETSQVISLPNKNMEVTNYMNCTNLLCSKWKIIICNEDICSPYNKTIHEPECSEHTCRVALKVEYHFVCNTTNITNATIIMHTKTIVLRTMFYEQDIKVIFRLTHNTTDVSIQLSGNPGYIKSLPIISSNNLKNHTAHFFNGTFSAIKYPDNINGYCYLSNVTHKTINFQNNIRSKCSLVHNNITIHNNASNNCKHMQEEILNMLDTKSKKFISPLGNPIILDDNDWIELKYEFNNVVYGEYNNEKNILSCKNLATKLSYVFTYADIGDDSKVKYKIFDIKAYMTTETVIYSNDELTNVITVDVTFLDITKPPVYEYAGAPSLNIYLPEDFFYPFTYNKANLIYSELYCYAMFLISFYGLIGFHV